MSEGALCLAMALDVALGWPDWLYRRVGHPVGGFARIISAGVRFGNRPRFSSSRRRSHGAATVFAVTGVAGGLGLAAQIAAFALFGTAGWALVALLAFPALAMRSLHDHVMRVARELDGARLAQARGAVTMIVGRDTAALDAAGVSRAAIESLAESFCDAVVAPLFWFAILGLPGIWMYKAINTADSLIGHRESPWTDFGWAAARTDDAANWLPARAAGAMLCLAGAGGWRVLMRDHARHASPNAGWPEAAMAGVLGIRLAGPITYDGELHDKAFIGDGEDAIPRDVHRALAIYRRACAFLFLLAGMFLWLV